jgi:hypothetical protein
MKFAKKNSQSPEESPDYYCTARDLVEQLADQMGPADAMLVLVHAAVLIHERAAQPDQGRSIEDAAEIFCKTMCDLEEDVIRREAPLQ